MVAFNGVSMATIGGAILGAGRSATWLMGTKGSFRLYQGNTPFSILEAS